MSSQNSRRMLCASAAQALGGPEVYESDKEWPVKMLIAERLKNGHKQYMVIWDGYDFTYVTWEFTTKIMDTRLINQFVTSVSGIRHELWLFRETVAFEVGKLREEKGDMTVPISGIHGAEAFALLCYLSRPPSRFGGEPLELIIDRPVGWPGSGWSSGSSMNTPPPTVHVWQVNPARRG